MAPSLYFPSAPRGASPRMMTWCISCMRRHEDGHRFLLRMTRINYLWTTMSLERILLQGSFMSKVTIPRSLPRYQLKIPNSIRHAACHLEIWRCFKLMTWCWKVKEHLFGTYTFLFIPFCLKINCQNWSWKSEEGKEGEVVNKYSRASWCLYSLLWQSFTWGGENWILQGACDV